MVSRVGVDSSMPPRGVTVRKTLKTSTVSGGGTVMNDYLRDREGKFAGSRKGATPPQSGPVVPTVNAGSASQAAASDYALVYSAFRGSDVRPGSDEWLAEMRPSALPMFEGPFSQEGFDEFTWQIALACAELMSEGRVFETEVVGVDEHWRPVRIVEGPEDSVPVWISPNQVNQVRVPGSPLDNTDTVRRVFQHLNIRAAYLGTQALYESDGPDGPEHSASYVVDGLFTPTGYRRVIIAPLVGEEGNRQVGEMDDSTELPPGVRLSSSPLARCFL